MKRHGGDNDELSVAKRQRVCNRFAELLPNVLCMLITSFLPLVDMAHVAQLNRYWEDALRTTATSASHKYICKNASLSVPLWRGAVVQELIMEPGQSASAEYTTCLPRFLSKLHKRLPRLRMLRLECPSFPRVHYAWNKYQLPVGLHELEIVTYTSHAMECSIDTIALMRAIAQLVHLRELTIYTANLGEALIAKEPFSLRPLQDLHALQSIELGVELSSVEDHIQPLLLAPALRRVTVDSLTHDCAEAVRRASVPWTHFEWSYVRDTASARTDLPLLVASMYALEELTVASRYDLQPLLNVPILHLQQLALHFYDDPAHLIPNTLLDALCVSYPNLTGLSLSGSLIAIKSAQIETCVRNLPKLASLELDGLRALDSLDFLSPLTNTLTELDITDTRLPLTAEALERVATMKKLQSLELSRTFSTPLTRLHMFSFEMPTRIHSMPQLEHLVYE
jgi:hypothetical protein